MSKEVVAEVIALIELGMIAPEDIVKRLRKANSEPEKALAEQPAQQEFVGQLQEEAFGRGQVMWFNKPADKSMLYTFPPAQRKPLTWERVLEIGLECANDHSRLPYEVKVARAIEAAHGIKENT